MKGIVLAGDVGSSLAAALSSWAGEISFLCVSSARTWAVPSAGMARPRQHGQHIRAEMKCGCDEVMVSEVTTYLESRDGCSGNCEDMMALHCPMFPDWTWSIGSPGEAIKVSTVTLREV